MLREVSEQYYLDNRDFCLQYARQLNEADTTDRAIEIAEEGLDTFSDTGAIRCFLSPSRCLLRLFRCRACCSVDHSQVIIDGQGNGIVTDGKGESCFEWIH